jgi:hypothetical protein
VPRVARMTRCLGEYSDGLRDEGKREYRQGRVPSRTH